jgi:uncharacterized protein (TIGR02001 family)
MVSDYTFRGISQTDEHPAVQGGFDYAHSSGLYFGVWGSNVDFNDGSIASLESDIYGGLKFSNVGINWDIGGNETYYPGTHQGTDHYNYFEGKISANRELGPVDTTALFAYSPNNFGDSGHSAYVNLAVSAPVSDTGFNFQAALGHQWVQNNANFGVPDYSDWSVGLSYPWQGFDIGLKYVDTNLSKIDCVDGCDARGVFSVTRSFN